MADEFEHFETAADYLASLIPPRGPLFSEMEAYAKAHYVPIARPETAQLLSVLVRLSGAQKILEIGTAIGYSALVMQKAAGGKVEIFTLEQSYERVIKAKEFIGRAGAEGAIRIVGGDAAEILPALKETYDFIFLDAAKGQYQAFLPDLLRVLRTGGLLVTDNVLFHGMIAEGKSPERRDKTIVRRLRAYLEEISNHPQLQTTVLPLGDGVSVSIKL